MVTRDGGIVGFREEEGAVRGGNYNTFCLFGGPYQRSARGNGEAGVDGVCGVIIR